MSLWSFGIGYFLPFLPYIDQRASHRSEFGTRILHLAPPFLSPFRNSAPLSSSRPLLIHWFAPEWKGKASWVPGEYPYWITEEVVPPGSTFVQVLGPRGDRPVGTPRKPGTPGSQGTPGIRGTPGSQGTLGGKNTPSRKSTPGGQPTPGSQKTPGRVGNTPGAAPPRPVAAKEVYNTPPARRPFLSASDKARRAQEAEGKIGKTGEGKRDANREARIRPETPTSKRKIEGVREEMREGRRPETSGLKRVVTTPGSEKRLHISPGSEKRLHISPGSEKRPHTPGSEKRPHISPGLEKRPHTAPRVGQACPGSIKKSPRYRGTSKASQIDDS